MTIIYVYKQDPKYPISNIAYMSVTIQSRPDNTAAGVGDQMVAASGRPQSRVRHEEERQSQEHLLLASRDQDQ